MLFAHLRIDRKLPIIKGSYDLEQSTNRIMAS